MHVGRARAQIRDQELYRDQCATFEQYCRQRFGLSQSSAHNLMGSAQVGDDLSSIEDLPKPSNEALARCRIDVPKEKRLTVESGGMAGESLITAKLVTAGEVVSPFKSRTLPTKSKRSQNAGQFNLNPPWSCSVKSKTCRLGKDRAFVSETHGIEELDC